MAKKRAKARRRISSNRVELVCRKGTCFVRPPDKRVKRLKQIVWHGANTGGTIMFPTTCPFGWRIRSFPRGGSVASGPALAGCALGKYEYIAYCTHCQKKGSRLLARGRSNPRVIVDP